MKPSGNDDNIVSQAMVTAEFAHEISNIVILTWWMVKEAVTMYSQSIVKKTPENTERTPNADLMLCQRLRRWPNIESALGRYPVLAG